MTTMIDNAGVRLALSREGDGPDVLFAHGLGSAQVLWEPLISTLSDCFTCWNLDLRGHGGSDRAPGRYSLAHYTSDVEAALAHIGRPVVGIGHSLGGVAIVRAATNPATSLRAAYAVDAPILRLAGEVSTSLAIFERQLGMVRSFQPDGRPVDDYEAVLAQAPYVGGGINRATSCQPSSEAGPSRCRSWTPSASRPS